MSFRFGIDELLDNQSQMADLRQKRCALVAHPASVTATLRHSLDALIENGCQVIRAFGPQHGMRGDKQDNMVETEDYLDPTHQIPVISLYSDFRRPTAEMLEDLDIVLFDLQDIGCRIYTYIATLKYFLEEAAKCHVQIWVLDRPNPAGRPIDGSYLEPGFESFVGCDEIPTRHGLTTGELALWFKHSGSLETDLKIIKMRDYYPSEAPGYGWPEMSAWVNPSPNASSVNMTRIFPGSVLIEGTELSEGRGTTIPLEVIGAPDFPAEEILELLHSQAPHWLSGILVRPCFFEPTFHKHQGKLCKGLQFHTRFDGYLHEEFQPYRLIAGCLKALRLLRPDYPIWRDFYYEYETGKLPIDVINGGEALRHWVDDKNATFDQFAKLISEHENLWLEQRQAHLLY